jgi:hypothetical protein
MTVFHDFAPKAYGPTVAMPATSFPNDLRPELYEEFS